MDDKLSRVRTATEAVTRERDEAQRSAVRAIRVMLEKLRDAVGSEQLRLPNLGTSVVYWRGVQVLAKTVDEKLPVPLKGPGDGREVLCISSKGFLVFAKLRNDLVTLTSGVADADIRAEWPDEVAEAISAAIDYHLHGCDRSQTRYLKLRQLNQRLEAALNEVER